MTDTTWTTEEYRCPLTGDRPERTCPKCNGTGERPSVEITSTVRDYFGILSSWTKCFDCAGFGTLRGDA